MKNKTKIVGALVMLLVLPSFAFAAGRDKTGDCVVWQDGDGAYDPYHYCDQVNETLARLHTLEIENAQLEAKLASQQPVASAEPVQPIVQSSGTDAATLQRVSSLESRVSVLEQTVGVIRDAIFGALNKIIALLKK